MARRNECLECKVFVGGLPNDASTRRPPGFAFVEFEDSRDAEDAVKGLDGTRICGVRPRVEFSHGGSRRGGRGGGGRRRSSPLPPYQRFLRNSFYEFSFRSLHTTTALRYPFARWSLPEMYHVYVTAKLPHFFLLVPLNSDVQYCMTDKCLRIEKQEDPLSYQYYNWLILTPIRRRSLSRSRSPPPRRSPRYSRSRSRSLNRLVVDHFPTCLLNMSRRSDPLDCKVYVGGLPQDATSQELEDAFNRFGRIRKVWVARRPPGFAFVEFEDARDAEDAVKALDGTRICGVRARVEISHGRRRNGGYGGGGGGGGGGYYEGGRRRSRQDNSLFVFAISADQTPFIS
ncbi:Serine/arginine-rich splicing factor 3 [Dirofilaria immitis]|nr:Serine/arginine-rich splicing factor 3 [Dirofilaria immitis]